MSFKGKIRHYPNVGTPVQGLLRGDGPKKIRWIDATYGGKDSKHGHHFIVGKTIMPEGAFSFWYVPMPTEAKSATLH